MDLPLLVIIAERRKAEFDRLQRLAAAGSPGCRAARAQMIRLRTEELKEDLRT